MKILLIVIICIFVLSVLMPINNNAYSVEPTATPPDPSNHHYLPYIVKKYATATPPIPGELDENN